jgi:hypothetical protein
MHTLRSECSTPNECIALLYETALYLNVRPKIQKSLLCCLHLKKKEKFRPLACKMLDHSHMPILSSCMLSVLLQYSSVLMADNVHICVDDEGCCIVGVWLRGETL